MKICVIGLTRSRSSVFLESISNFYTIPVIGHAFNDLPQQLPNRGWLDDQSLPEIPAEHWRKVKQLLAYIENDVNGVIRYHPDQLSFIPFSGELIDFDLFNFKQYNKIYLTVRRDIAAMIGSRFIASELNQWTYYKKSDIRETITPKVIDSNGEYNIRLALYNEITVRLLKEYFIKNNIQFEEVDYVDIPAYIKNHFPKENKLANLETNYDYSKIITNYDKIMDLYQKFKPEVEELFSRLNPRVYK